MSNIEFKKGQLTQKEQDDIAAGFARHSAQSVAPGYKKERLNWLVYAEDNQSVVAALTADILWDWLYIDEVWVDESLRRSGLGKTLMNHAEDYARSHRLTGLWLWTQSWQAAAFYQKLGYQEFTRFPDFPKGHYRLGMSKKLCDLATGVTDQ